MEQPPEMVSMRSSHLLSLVLALAPLPLSAQQVQDAWKSARSQATVWSTSARSVDNTSARIVCIDPGGFRAELVLEVEVFGSGPLRGARQAVASVEGSDVRLPLAPVGSAPGTDTVLRWTGLGRPAFEAMRRLATALEEKGVLSVAGPDGSAVAVGRQSAMADVRDVVLRCAPSVVSLRNRLAGMRDPAALVVLAGEANSRCRGGSGDEDETWTSCAERTELGERLAVLGWCYGRQGEAGYQMSWHRCGPRSNR